MKRTTPAQQRKRLFAMIAFGLTVVTMVFLVVLDLPAPSSNEGLSGTMMENEASSFVWRSGAMAASLDEGLTISLSNLPLSFQTGTEWRLAASRSAEWSRDGACTLRQWSQGDEMPSSEFLFIPRSAECLDAGPWNVFAVDADGTSHRLPGVLTIRSGQSSIELTSLSPAIGHQGRVELEFAVHRPASADGFDGVYERPVDIWVSDGDDVCVAPAAPVNVPRGTVRTGKNWMETRATASADLKAFKKVRDHDPFASDAHVPSSDEVDMRGNCNLGEGVYDVMIGPTERGYVEASKFRVHARPVQVDADPIVVSVPTGETEEARFTIRNFSAAPAAWSAEATDMSAGKWLASSLNQVLKGKEKARGLLSFSAHDLAPGLYTTDVVVRVDDFYGTEVRIPVEMKVLPARSSRSAGGVAAEDALPGEFNISNYPNPFTAYTTMRIEILQPGQVSVSVYDMTGRLVETLVDEYLSEGVHEFRFEADNLASGTYIYRVTTPGGQKSETMTLVR